MKRDAKSKWKGHKVSDVIPKSTANSTPKLTIAGAAGSGWGDAWEYVLDTNATNWRTVEVPKLLRSFWLEAATTTSGSTTAQLVYPALVNYVEHLAQLDDEDDDFLDAETAAAASRALNSIAQTNAPPPRLFSHGGNALVLTWDGALSSHLMTITKRKMVMLHVDHQTNERTSVPVDLESVGGRANWVSKLSDHPSVPSLRLHTF